jgi:purine-nucleoside phosphorylase
MSKLLLTLILSIFFIILQMIHSTSENIQALNDSMGYINKANHIRPKFALVLGSGLNLSADSFNITVNIKARDIPNYPVSSVKNHAGDLLFGFLKRDFGHSTPLLVFQGRIHFYETGSLFNILYPIIIANRLGISKIIITNAAGGISNAYNIGDLMLIIDLLDLTFLNQLPVPDFFNRKQAGYFDDELRRDAFRSSVKLSIPLRQGTYCWLKGPSYETPAEIRMLRQIGADAVGMSTAPEIFMASELGMKVLAISLISNLAAGISPKKLSHDDVTLAAERSGQKLMDLLEDIILAGKHKN